MKDILIRNIISLLERNARNASRKCLFRGCSNTSIDSHLLQKRGIINQIAEHNHVMELANDSFREGVFHFKRVGINKSFAFKGFCSTHDHELFKEIENGVIDYTNYRTQLLFSYRAVMNEKRKKEIVVDWHTRISNSTSLQLLTSDEYMEQNRLWIEGNNDGIADEAHYESIFLTNINDRTRNDFRFMTYELPRIEMCASGVFTYETSIEIQRMMMSANYRREIPLTEIYFTLLPLADKSIVIIGCDLNRVNICWNYIESFNAPTDEQKLKKISDLFLCQLENWVCSVSLYNSKFKQKENRIVQTWHESIRHPNERRELNYSMFT